MPFVVDNSLAFIRENDGEGAVDLARGLKFVVTGGYKDGSYSGWVTSPRWKFKLRVRPSSNRHPDSPPGLTPKEFLLWWKEHENTDHRVHLLVSVPLIEGEWDLPDTPLDLAREIAVAKEISRGTERWRTSTS